MDVDNVRGREVNGSGMLFQDGALACFYLYLFSGGWIVTLAGLGLSIGAGVRSCRFAVGGWLAAGCFAPFLYVQGLRWLQGLAPSVQTTDLALFVILGGLAGAVFGAPVTGLVLLLRRREKAPSPEGEGLVG